MLWLILKIRLIREIVVQMAVLLMHVDEVVTALLQTRTLRHNYLPVHDLIL